MKRLLLIFIILLWPLLIKAQVDVGDPAPDFSYETLSGDTITLFDYRGQVVFLFFFGYG